MIDRAPKAPYKQHVAFEVTTMVMTFAVLPITYALNISPYLILCAMALCCVSIIALLTRNSYGFDNKISPVIWVFGIYLCWLLLELIVSPSMSALLRIVQATCCLLVFEFGSKASLSDTSLRITKYFVEAILITCILDWLLTGCTLSGYSGFSTNPNSFASMLLCWFPLLLVRQKHNPFDLLFAAVCLFLIVVSSSRGVLAAIIILLTIWFAAKTMRGKSSFKSIARVCFILFLASMIAFVGLYAFLSTTQFGLELNVLSQQMFHKDFFSGRQKLWGSILNLIFERPLMGYGLDALPSQFLDLGWSSHNLFLQTTLQSGIPGLVLLCILLVSILQRLTSMQLTGDRSIILSFMFAVVFHESLEICLTQNVLCCGLMMWCLFGLGCSPALDKRLVEKRQIKTHQEATHEEYQSAEVSRNVSAT